MSSEDGISVFRVTYEFPPSIGGSSVHISELARRINSRLKYQIIIAPTFAGMGAEFDSPFEVPVLRVKTSAFLDALARRKMPVRLLVLISYALSIARELRRRVPAHTNPVIHVHGTLLGALLTVTLPAFCVRCPVVVMQHSGDPFRVSRRSAMMTTLALLLFRIRKPSSLLVLDDGMGAARFVQLLSDWGIPGRVVNHGIDCGSPDMYTPSHADEFTVISTSRLIPFKRVDMAIAAFLQFCSRSPDSKVRMLIVGDGPERSRLQKLCQSSQFGGLVNFLGERSHGETIHLIRGSDVLLATSPFSNLNISVLEAMCEGKIVLAFDNGEMESIIKHREDGYLVSPGDIDGMAKCMESILRMPSTQLEIGRAASAHVREARSWQSRIDAELDVYRRAVGQG
jgi:glycosyltransferase involved in cell wall biosynthesis